MFEINNMKIIFTAAIFAVSLFAFVSEAETPYQKEGEKFSVGVRGGVTISSVMFNPGLSSKTMGAESYPQVVYGGQLGVVFNYRIKGWFYLQPGVTYSMQGSKIEKGYVTHWSYSDLRNDILARFEKVRYKENALIHYLKFPLLLSFRSSEHKSIQFLCNTGPYLAAGLAGDIRYSRIDNYSNEIEKNTEPFFEGDRYKRFDAGWHLGLGIKFKRFYVGGYYEISFVDLRDFEKRLKQPYLNSVGSISLGYDFAIRGRN